MSLQFFGAREVRVIRRVEGIVRKKHINRGIRMLALLTSDWVILSDVWGFSYDTLL
jgi:hypothetical protein